MYARSFRRLLSFVLYFLLLGCLVKPRESVTNRQRIITKKEDKFPWGSLRLPQTLFPIKYNITLDTDLKTFHVKGNVGILIKCAKPTANIILHLKDMNVVKTAVVEKKQEDVAASVDVQDVHEDDELNQRSEKRQQDTELHVLGTMSNKTLAMFLIRVNEKLVSGKTYMIYIEFNYPLTDKLVGFYRSSYAAKNGEKR